MVFFHSLKIFTITILSSLPDNASTLALSKAVSIVYYFPVNNDTFIFVCLVIFFFENWSDLENIFLLLQMLILSSMWLLVLFASLIIYLVTEMNRSQKAYFSSNVQFLIFFHQFFSPLFLSLSLAA